MTKPIKPIYFDPTYYWSIKIKYEIDNLFRLKDGLKFATFQIILSFFLFFFWIYIFCFSH